VEVNGRNVQFEVHASFFLLAIVSLMNMITSQCQITGSFVPVNNGVLLNRSEEGVAINQQDSFTILDSRNPFRAWGILLIKFPTLFNKANVQV
jgi:hypothetical protein